MQTEAELNRQGNTHREGNRHADALDCFDLAIALNPNIAALHVNRGIALRALRRQVDAVTSYDRAIALDPGCAEAHANKGNALQDLLLYEQALASYDQAIAIRSNYCAAHCHRGLALAALQRHGEALASYDQAIALAPNYFEAHNNRGNTLRAMKQDDEALASYQRAIAARPDSAEAYRNRGVAFHDLHRYEEALASFDLALKLKPDYVEAFVNRGAVLTDLRRIEEALASFDQAIALRPDQAHAYNFRGNALRALRRSADALRSYDHAIRLEPGLAEAFSNRGIALSELGRNGEAIASFDRAIVLKPDLVEAYVNRGALFDQLRHFEKAASDYGQALVLNPDLPHVPGDRVFCKMQGGDWEDYRAENERILAAIDSGARAAKPFVVSALPSSVAQQQRCAQAHIAAEFPARLILWQGPSAHGRIRIAYFSADFHNHATAHLLAEMIEKHDRTRFEVNGFSFGPAPAKDDAWRRRLASAFDHFIDVSGQSDRETATLAHEMEIDIAVDLKGFTQDSRTGIFALRPAPIQVNYLGYPGTMGADFIDYIVADATVIPEEHRRYYTEKVVYLPHSYQVNDSTKSIAARQFSRAELGLPEDGFVFCCFNNSYKITPEIFDIWMRLLSKVAGSVLWLFEGNSSAAKNLCVEAERRGIPRDRLVFAPRMELAEHLSRHRQADLFLDTPCYNAHTTASDALWAGLPLLTCLGNTFAGRVAASLLRAIDMPELVTGSLEEYEAFALELATSPECLGQIRRKLAQHRSIKPLFDTALFTRHIESAYTAMWQRHQAGLAPDHLCVGA